MLSHLKIVPESLLSKLFKLFGSWGRCHSNNMSTHGYSHLERPSRDT